MFGVLYHSAPRRFLGIFFYMNLEFFEPEKTKVKRMYKLGKDKHEESYFDKTPKPTKNGVLKKDKNKQSNISP